MKIKKIFSIVLSAVLLISATFSLGIVAGAENIISQDGLWSCYFNEEKDTVNLRYIGEQEDVVVPMELEGKKVATAYFTRNTFVKSVVYPESFPNLGGEDCFSGCTALESVVLPEVIETIPMQTFLDTVSLKEITIPSSVKRIEIDAFMNSGIQKIVFNEGLQQIKKAAFYGCKNLESLSFPDTCGYLGQVAFARCENLKTVKLSKKMKEINNSVFSHCTSLERVEFPEKLSKIGSSAFSETALKKVVLPETTIVYGSAFSGCKDLTSVTFNGKVNNIGRYAFSKCVNLKTVNFTKGYLKKVYDYAFYTCEKLDKVTISNTKNVPTIAKSAFNKAKSGIKFYVKNKTVAKKLKATLQKTNIKKAKIYRSAPILLYKNVG